MERLTPEAGSEMIRVLKHHMQMYCKLADQVPQYASRFDKIREEMQSLSNWIFINDVDPNFKDKTTEEKVQQTDDYKRGFYDGSKGWGLQPDMPHNYQLGWSDGNQHANTDLI